MNRNQSQGTTDSNAQADYFDLHVKGCGYLSRIREVSVRQGKEKFLACAVSAMHGLCNDPSYSYFDFKVTGDDAENLVRSLWVDVDANRKVFIAFRAGDIYADAYMGKMKDPKTGQLTGELEPRATIKGRLLQITHAQVDGEVVFSSDENKPSAADPDAAGSPSESATPAPESNEPEQRSGPARSEERAALPQRQFDPRAHGEPAMAS